MCWLLYVVRCSLFVVVVGCLSTAECCLLCVGCCFLCAVCLVSVVRGVLFVVRCLKSFFDVGWLNVLCLVCCPLCVVNGLLFGVIGHGLLVVGCW